MRTHRPRGRHHRTGRPGMAGRRQGIVWGAPLATGVFLVALGADLSSPVAAPAAAPIPAFSRMYGTACSTCHVAAPKLNVLGEAFRLNGYRMPDTELLVRRDDPVPLGDEAWKEQWPRAIWPGEVPGVAPLALRIQTDAAAPLAGEDAGGVDLRFPHEVYLLAGAPLGGSVSAFFEAEWTPDDGVELVQARLLFNDLVSSLPEGTLNLWLGLQNPYLFTLADRQIDRAARQKFTWQEFSPSELPLVTPNGDELAPADAFALGGTLPAVEVNGVMGGRFRWGVGMAQAAGHDGEDGARPVDAYYKARYKLGGMDLQGHYGEGASPVTGTGGQLLDRSLVVEHFGYFGRDPAPGGEGVDRRSFGVAARGLLGRLDAGVGYTWSRYDAPWGERLPGSLEATSLFGKAEYLFFPWLIGSLKAEAFRTDLPVRAATGGTVVAGDRDRIVPGAVALIRHNLRAVVEAELFTRDARARAAGLERPSTLWFRLDVAF